MRQQRSSLSIAFATAAVALAALAVAAGCAPTSTGTTGPGAQPTTTQAVATLKPIHKPWTDSTFRPGYLKSVSGNSTVVIQPARYTPVAGSDTFTLTPLAEPAPTTYSLAPDAALYVSYVWTDGAAQAGGDDFKSVTYSQLSDYAKSIGNSTQDFSPEVWFAVNGKGEITLLFQVYHP